jgi:hypothetical protein
MNNILFAHVKLIRSFLISKETSDFSKRTLLSIPLIAWESCDDGYIYKSSNDRIISKHSEGKDVLGSGGGKF